MLGPLALREVSTGLNILKPALCLTVPLCSFADYLWETHNKGKLWKDIRVKYENAEEEEA